MHRCSPHRLSSALHFPPLTSSRQAGEGGTLATKRGLMISRDRTQTKHGSILSWSGSACHNFHRTGGSQHPTSSRCRHECRQHTSLHCAASRSPRVGKSTGGKASRTKESSKKASSTLQLLINCTTARPMGLPQITKRCRRCLFQTDPRLSTTRPQSWWRTWVNGTAGRCRTYTAATRFPSAAVPPGIGRLLGARTDQASKGEGGKEREASVPKKRERGQPCC